MQVYLTLVRRLSSGSDWQFCASCADVAARDQRGYRGLGTVERICHSALEGNVFTAPLRYSSSRMIQSGL